MSADLANKIEAFRVLTESTLATTPSTLSSVVTALKPSVDALVVASAQYKGTDSHRLWLLINALDLTFQSWATNYSGS
jgi:hypothetical protein